MSPQRTHRSGVRQVHRELQRIREVRARRATFGTSCDKIRRVMSPRTVRIDQPGDIILRCCQAVRRTLGWPPPRCCRWLPGDLVHSRVYDWHACKSRRACAARRQPIATLAACACCCWQAIDQQRQAFDFDVESAQSTHRSQDATQPFQYVDGPLAPPTQSEH